MAISTGFMGLFGDFIEDVAAFEEHQRRYRNIQTNPDKPELTIKYDPLKNYWKNAFISA
jgi:hypothetical protein